MDADAAYSPYGDCVALTGGTAAAGTAKQVPGGPTGLVSMLVWNSDGTNAAFLGWGPTAAVAVQMAQEAAGLPGTAASVLPLPSGVIQSFTLPGNYFYSVYGVAGTPVVYMVPGGGI